jgi:hypothetical protein
MTDFHKFREEAAKNAHKYHPDYGICPTEGRTDDAFQFAEIGEYVMDEATAAQLRRLAEIQKEANETVFPPWVRF